MAKIVKTVKIRGVRGQCPSEPIWIKYIYTYMVQYERRSINILVYKVNYTIFSLSETIWIWEILFDIILDVVVLVSICITWKFILQFSGKAKKEFLKFGLCNFQAFPPLAPLSYSNWLLAIFFSSTATL